MDNDAVELATATGRPWHIGEFTSEAWLGAPLELQFTTLVVAWGSVGGERHTYAIAYDRDKCPPGQFPPDFQQEAAEAFRRAAYEGRLRAV